MEHETYEVVFRKYHVMHFPWGPNNEEVERLEGHHNVPLQNEEIQVKRLCHVTHNEPAQRISENREFYTFIPKRKMGKPAGERKTYAICEPTDEAPNRQTQYRHIPERKKVFPGLYVWWSVVVDDEQTIYWRDRQYYNEDGKYYITDGFRKPTQSVYGNKMFVVDFNTMLQCYQKAFVEQTRIQLRCGGTLRYKREIMKVIIVCREDEEKLPLHKYPVFPTGREFNLEYDRNGKVTPRGILKLVVTNGVSGSQKPERKDVSYSWDTYGFAFYFPGEGYTMEYPKPEANNGDIRTIDHDYFIGIKKFATCHSKVNNRCPNELPN